MEGESHICFLFARHVHIPTGRRESSWWDKLKRRDSSTLLAPWQLLCKLSLPPALINDMNVMSHTEIKTSINNCCLCSIVYRSEVEHMHGKMYRPKEPALPICSSLYPLSSASPPLSPSFSCERGPATECKWREETQEARWEISMSWKIQSSCGHFSDTETTVPLCGQI